MGVGWGAGTTGKGVYHGSGDQYRKQHLQYPESQGWAGGLDRPVGGISEVYEALFK